MGKLIDLNSKKSFEIKNKADTKAEIIIYDQIGLDWWGDGVSAKTFQKEMKELPSTVEQIDLRLNSPGGNVFDGVTIYNLLKQHKANVTVYIDGMAASIASIIAMAGDEIIIGEGAMFMIHKPMAGTYGNSVELLDMIDLLDNIENQMINIYKKKVSISDAELQKMILDETWINAEDAINMGFATRLAEDGEILNIAASYDTDKADWMKRKPTMKIKKQEDLIKEKIGKLKNDVEGFLAR